jgi:hypothetical protein
MPLERRYRAGETIEDVCRACKTDRLHTVIVVDGAGRPLRVTCDYCHSEHNYRGGPALGRPERPAPVPRAPVKAGTRDSGLGARGIEARIPDPGSRPGFSSNSPKATSDASNAMTPDNYNDLEVLLRRIIREEAGMTAVVPAPKWRGGMLVLRPGSPGLQEKTWPIETFFHKVVMVRNRLRTLEQQINASELPDDVKVKLQTYVTGCYGSLTSFNLLFADEEDQFKGSSGD